MTRALFLVLLLSLLLAGNALAQEATPPSDRLWEQIPLDGSVCARGTPYSFFVHRGSPQKLMIYFQGGGACWSAATCKPGGTFDDSVEPEELDRYRGIFDFDDPRNPFADYSFVVVAYCTGDVHTGSAATEYAVGDTRFTLRFNGFSNAQAVLAWTYANFDQPTSVIISGSSAGAYGAIFNAPYILAHYPDARAAVLGDAGIGVTVADWDGFSMWGTGENVFTGDAYEGVTPGSNLTTTLYSAAARAFPQASIAEYTSFGDQVQIGFYILQGGAREDWVVAMQSSFAELDTLENFRSYVGWGGTHAILPTPLFYQMQVDGVSFRDWFAALVNGESVASVQCDDCQTPELTTAP